MLSATASDVMPHFGDGLLSNEVYAIAVGDSLKRHDISRRWNNRTTQK